ncbi:MAG: hypothetical protein ACHQK9_07135 [Reyranellales bacterium]
MNARFLPLLALLIGLPGPAFAQSDDAAYCAQLAVLAYRFVGGNGGDGRSSPDLNTIGAIEDCRKGNTARGIPILEKRLRDSRVTLPKR